MTLATATFGADEFPANKWLVPAENTEKPAAKASTTVEPQLTANRARRRRSNKAGWREAAK
jgi:hypothetical protein